MLHCLDAKSKKIFRNFKEFCQTITDERADQVKNVEARYSDFCLLLNSKEFTHTLYSGSQTAKKVLKMSQKGNKHIWRSQESTQYVTESLNYHQV